MQIARAGLIVLLAGSICPVLSWQSAEKPEAKPQPQTAPESKEGSASQKSGSDVSKATGDVDILSDTMGVDFGPYLKRVADKIKTNWYRSVPDSAKAPTFKRGRVAIEFAVLKEGKIAGLKLVSSSGDQVLDRAAWGSITDSNPLPALPADFHGQYLQLRFRFFYNPTKTEDPTAPPAADKVAPAEKKPGP